ncbi:MAG: hypothetical protein KF901_31985 [Myxococcales bacterium]|nr:hypothetical protein [Myxococcales bacterium]
MTRTAHPLAFSLVLGLALSACGSGAPRDSPRGAGGAGHAAPAVGQERPAIGAAADQQSALDDRATLGVDAERACERDADCANTDFHGCCRPTDAACSCERRAIARSALRDALERCAEIECSVGTCPPCTPLADVLPARCVAGLCSLEAE